MVTNNDLYDRKAFYKVKNVFSSFSMNDGEFINHKYIKDYEKYKESSYRKYWDVNNLYGRPMSQKLLVNDFKWHKDISEFDEDLIKNYKDESDEGYFLEVDIQYLENLHNLHNDSPFLH